MRRCFIHIGTHKTGTSSIQRELDGARSQLAQCGFIYPKAGIPSGFFGHHNIAWQLNSDHRFRSDFGTIEDLFREIAGSHADIVVSSEDLECAVHRPERFASFVTDLKQFAPETTIVVYLRNQAGYVRSLFLELLKHGYNNSFDDFVSRVISEGILRWEHWTFAFCYRDFLNLLPDGVNVIVRSYDAVGSVVSDFASLLGLRPADPNRRENRQNSVSTAFADFYGNCLGRPPPEADSLIMRIIAGAFDRPGIDMTAATKNKLADAFRQSNRDVMSRHGIAEDMDPPMSDQGCDTRPGGRPCLEHVFSTTTVCLIDELEQRLAGRGDADDSIAIGTSHSKATAIDE